jgi:hypothetical protein
MNSNIPGVYIKHNKSVGKIIEQDFATLFLIFNDDNFNTPLITIDNFSQVNEYSFIKKNIFLQKAIEVYFANKGDKLYILNYPIKTKQSFDLLEFESFLSRSCDTLMDLEVIISPDLYGKKIYGNILGQRDIVAIQRSINNYCSASHRVSITDIPNDFDFNYLDIFGETSIYYPWIIDKSSILLPPSIYVSAMFSKFAKENKLAASVANKEIINAINIEKTLTKDERGILLDNRINPIILVPHQGVKIWGTKAFDSKVDTSTEQRIMKYIKRNLYRIGKAYVFEPNDNKLKDKILLHVESFLYKLWKAGGLAGETKEQAYNSSGDIITTDMDDKILTINIAVSLVKPIEFIYIELNKVAQDGTQSTLSIS